jgi:hypothetical protein
MNLMSVVVPVILMIALTAAAQGTTNVNDDVKTRAWMSA